MEVALEDVYVLIHEKRITHKKDLLSLLEQITGSGKPLLIIAEDVEGEALARPLQQTSTSQTYRSPTSVRPEKSPSIRTTQWSKAGFKYEQLP
jgi:hypothetical protein